MKIMALAADNFDSTVARSSCLVIEFSKDIEDFADRAGKVTDADRVEWGHVDVQAETRLAASFGIETESALLIFRERVVLYLEGGKHDPVTMGELVRRISALDMPVIKSEIQAQKEAELALHARRTCPTAQRGPIVT